MIHFDKEHYLCLNPQCLSARFVVFDNDIDLRSHEINIHGAASGGGTKIKLEFRVRRPGEGAENEQTVPTDHDFRFGLNGDVFIPEALPSLQRQQVNEPFITYGPHAERTAQLRAEAERLRLLSQQQQEEAFPSLGGPSEEIRSTTAASFMGWASEGVVGSALTRNNPRALTHQNFPPLESSNPLSRYTDNTGLRLNNLTMNRGLSRQSNLQSTAVGSGSYLNTAISSTNVKPNGFSSTPNLNDNASVSRPTTSFSATSSDFPTLVPLPNPRNKISSLRYDSAAAFAKKNNSISSEGNAWSSNVSASPTNDSIDAGIVQVENMKAYMGPKYKSLKLLTKNFASNQIHAESYVDQALALFEDGIHDEMFWYFLPNLIRSCPNEQNSRKAQQYLESLR